MVAEDVKLSKSVSVLANPRLRGTSFRGVEDLDSSREERSDHANPELLERGVTHDSHALEVLAMFDVEFELVEERSGGEAPEVVQLEQHPRLAVFDERFEFGHHSLVVAVFEAAGYVDPREAGFVLA